MIIEHRTRDNHQNADSLSKKTEFYERLEEKQANQSEIKDGFSFLDKETYDKLPLTRTRQVVRQVRASYTRTP